MLKYNVMTEETITKIVSKLTEGVTVPDLSAIEARYPERNLPQGAVVTRSAPSPTGFVHIGTIYMCLLNQFLASQSGGRYLLRIEDTDKKREVARGTEQIINALQAFALVPDEYEDANSVVHSPDERHYGPYLQSERKELYLAYAVKLLHEGRAYPCFATQEELEQNIKNQQAAKVRPGYYGQWALWRDKPEAAIVDALNAGKSFVLRFRSQGDHQARILIKDALKGPVELPQNDLDVPLIKADGTQLPTYHLAHVVDDHLMKSTIILRGDEWLPSTPLHIELAQALGFGAFTYAHFAPISVLDKNGGGKRKLSKRKDPEADVQYWLTAGYPLKGIKAYLLGLANSNFEDWYREHSIEPLEDFTISLEKLAASRAPLLDHAKLEDYCKDVIARLPQADFNSAVIDYVKNSGISYREDPTIQSTTFYESLTKDVNYTNTVLALERSGEKPRKDVAKWKDIYEQYGYFFNDEFSKNFAPDIPATLANLEKVVPMAVNAFLASYNATDDQPTWFEKLKQAAETCNFATDNKAYKEDQKLPENERKFVGNTADFAKILRVKLTGKDRTPDLFAIMQVMGSARVINRLN